MNETNNLSRYRSAIMDRANEQESDRVRRHIIESSDSYLVGALSTVVSEEDWDKATQIALDSAVRVGAKVVR